MLGTGLALFQLAVRRLFNLPPPATWSDTSTWNDNATWSDAA